MKKHILFIMTVLLAVTPAISFAALDGVKTLLTDINQILKLTIPVAVGVALLYFMWGVIDFIRHADDEKKRDESKQKMIWGVVGLFVIVSIAGILNFIGSSLGISTGGFGGSSGSTLQGSLGGDGSPGSPDCADPLNGNCGDSMGGGQPF